MSGTIGLDTMAVAVSGHLDSDSIGMLAVIDGGGKFGDMGERWETAGVGTCKPPVGRES